MNGKLWLIIGAIGGLVLCYIFLNMLFWLVIVMTGVYAAWRVYRRLSIAPGHHINHGLLKGYLSQQYGDEEGSKLYKRFVQELNRKGYR